IGGAAIGYVLYVRSAGADVRGSSVEFVPSDAPRFRQTGSTVAWPQFGLDDGRLHALPSTLRPPFRQKWRFRAHSLLEFPPSIAGGRLYFSSNDGVVYALDASTGKPAWRFRSGRCVAASPALSHGV